MKKLFLPLLVSTALISGASFAAESMSTNVSNSVFTGPYIGVYGGYNWSDLDGGLADPEGLDYGVFAGVKVDGLLDRVNGLGLGLNGAVEGFYGSSSADDGGVDKDEDWGVSFRPGMSIITDVTGDLGFNPYGILGYRRTEFEAAGASERYNGFELGLGTEILAFGDIGVRADYSHTFYASEGGIDVDSDDVRIGAAYHF